MGKEVSIETCLRSLHEINQQLQRDDIRIDEALELYEQGAKLVVEARAILDGYREKIDTIESTTLLRDGR